MGAKATSGLALILASLSLVIGGVAYWRSGGKQDVAAARESVTRDMDVVADDINHLVNRASKATQAGYEASRVRLKRAGQRIGELEHSVAEGIESDIERARKDIELLEQRIAKEAESVKGSTVDEAHRAEQSVARKVHRIEARVDVLEAESKIRRSVKLAESQEFEQAGRSLHEAITLLKQAETYLGDDDGFDDKIIKVRQSILDAAEQVEARAKDARTQIGKAIDDGRELVSALEAGDHEPEIGPVDNVGGSNKTDPL